MKVKKNKIKKSKEDIVLDIIIYSILIFIFICTFYPMWYVLVASFSSSSYVARTGGLLLWPGDFSLKAYKLVAEDARIWLGLKNTLLVLVLSLPLNILLTVCCGYFMSAKGPMLKKIIVALITFTMFFSGGMVPAYLNVKSLGLYNTVWALVLPGAMSVYNSIICKTAIQGIPDSLSESAYLDGASDIQVMFKIILPLIKATMAVLLLYYGVAHWNAWFNASIYLKDSAKLPVQNIIRDILLMSSELGDTSAEEYNEYAETIRYAAIIVSTAPILCVYPYLQKYFTKGTLVGAVKG